MAPLCAGNDRALRAGNPPRCNECFAVDRGGTGDHHGEFCSMWRLVARAPSPEKLRALLDAARASQQRGTIRDAEERFFNTRLRDGARDMLKRNADGTYSPARYFSDRERLEAMARVAAVLNDRKGFHVNDLDDETRGALLGAIVGAVLGPA